MGYRLLPTILPGSLLGVILALIVTSGAAQTSSELAATPEMINASTPLGSFITTTLWLKNTSGQSITAVLYEDRSISMIAAGTSPQPSATARRASPLRVPLPRQAERVDPRIAREIDQSPDGKTTVLVFLRDQADLSAAAAIPGWSERGTAVYRTLVEQAERSQAPLRRLLTTRGIAFRSFWIVNALALRADEKLIEELAARQEVALLRANDVYALPQPLQTSSTNVGWNLQLIGVDKAWSTFGIYGEGIVVANIDTGVEISHTALLRQYRGWRGDGVMDHNYNWFDPTGRYPLEPYDPSGHGTHTMGIMVGAATENSPAVGLAPKARWIAARGCDTLFCDSTWLIAAAEWILAPTDLQGANPRPDLRPHIVNNSWGGAGGDDWYAGYVTAWNAAGIFSTFAAGNSGMMGCGSVSSPGDYPESLAVGATTSEDVIATFSGRGPTRDGRIKPDITAPGHQIISAVPGNGYTSYSGTSMAAPHVAALAALLWSANPALIGDLAETRAIIEQTAVAIPSGECGDSGSTIPNNAYGWGRIDAYAALTRARVDIAWLDAPHEVSIEPGGLATIPVTLDGRMVAGPGLYWARLLVGNGSSEPLHPITVALTVEDAPDAVRLSGTLRDRRTGSGVQGSVSIAGGPTITTDSFGGYTLTLRAGGYEASAQAYGYLSATAALSLSADTNSDWELTRDAAHMVLSAAPISATLDFGEAWMVPITITNEGPRTLSTTLTIPPIEYSVEQPKTGSPSIAWYNLSSVEPLALRDDQVYTDAILLGFSMPVYGTFYDRFYLSSNGWISFTPTKDARPLARCFPTASLPQHTFAPLWLDLDPSQGGAIRAAQVTSDTFVVSFEGVPRWDTHPGPHVPTYTFQLALNSSGIVRYNYGQLGALPLRFSVGMQSSSSRGQSVSCGSEGDTPPGAGLALELEGQPQPSRWLSVDKTNLALAPGETTVLTVQLSGLAPWPWRTRPYSAAIKLQSNDPLLPVADLPAQLSVGSAPYSLTLPIIQR